MIPLNVRVNFSCFRALCGICLLALLCFADKSLAATPQPPGQIAVSPPRIEMQLGSKPVRKHLRLTNLGDQTISVAVGVSNWDLDAQNEVRVLPPTEQSLDQWMITNPTRFEIPAKGSQVVRFAVRPRVRPAPGEHRAIVYFNQLPAKETAADGFQVLFRLGVAVYAYVGDVSHSGKLHGIADGGRPGNRPQFQFDISATGDAHTRLDGQFVVWPKTAYPGRPGSRVLDGIERPGFELPEPLAAAGTLPTTPVLPGSRRKIPLSVGSVLDAGAYILDVKGTLGGKPIERAFPFKVSSAH